MLIDHLTEMILGNQTRFYDYDIAACVVYLIFNKQNHKICEWLGFPLPVCDS